MLAILPPEVTLRILSFSPVSSLASLLYLSKEWNGFIAEHESSIYRHSAYLHRLVGSPEANLKDVLLKLGGEMWDDVVSWKEFCAIYKPLLVL
jgi:hypothetical protein